MNPENLDGMIDVLNRERITLPKAKTEHFEGWDWLISHRGKVWWKLFVLMNEQFGFYSRSGKPPVETQELELVKEGEYVFGGGIDDITVIEKERDGPHDITTPSDPTIVTHIEVGSLSNSKKVISGVIDAGEFWWAGPIFNRIAPSPTTSFPDELWILTLDGDPHNLLEFYPQTENVGPPPLPDNNLWEKPGLWEREKS